MALFFSQDLFAWQGSNLRGTLLVFAIVLLVVKLLLNWRTKTQKYPPGPPRLPILGHLPFIAYFGIEGFTQWAAEKYGPVTTLWFGPVPKIFVNDVNVAKLAFRKYSVALAGRPTNPLFNTIADGAEGMGFGQYNKRLEFQRTFFLRLLKRMCSRKNSFEDIVKKHYSRLVKTLVEQQGKHYDPKTEIALTQAGVFYELWNGHLDGQEVRKDKTYLEAALYQNRFLGKFYGAVILVEMWQSLKVFVKVQLKTIVQLLGHLSGYFREHCEKRKLRLDNEKEDFLDMLCEEAKKVSVKERESLNITDDHLILRMLIDFNLGGLETIFRTIHWGMLYLSTKPDVQDRLFEEVQKVCDGKEPTLENLNSSPYVTAFFHEILRTSLVSPYGIERTLLKDAVIGDWAMPAGSKVIINSIYFSRSPDSFKDPETFNPERFLTDLNTFDANMASKFLPFSAGKRECVGKEVARDIIKMCFALLVSRCSFSLPTDTKADYTRISSLTVEALPYSICIKPR